jgi:hypothetical protein
MSQPATRPGNANKHPGQVVLDVNQVSRPKEVVAAEKEKQESSREIIQGCCLEKCSKADCSKGGRDGC